MFVIKTKANPITSRASGLLEKHHGPLFLVVVFLLGFVSRMFFMPYISGDMSIFLIQWLKEIREAGGLASLGSLVGNYTPPYMTLMALISYLPNDSVWLIKGISLLGDMFLTVSVYLLVKQLTGKLHMARLAFAAVWLLPTVILNSAAWGQCDAIYTGFLVLFLYAFLRDKKYAAGIFFGVAFAFKLQAVFLAPLVVLLVAAGKLRLRHVGTGIAAYVLLFLPSMVMGEGISVLWNVYAEQADQHTTLLSLEVPNIYSLMPYAREVNGWFMPAYTLFGLAIIGMVTYWFWLRRAHFTPKAILFMAAFYAMLAPQVLPKMHERYHFVADILTLIVAFVYLKAWPIALTTELLSFGAYMPFLLDVFPYDFRIGFLFALAALAGMGLLCVRTLREPAGEQPAFANRLTGALGRFIQKWHGLLFMAVVLGLGLWVRYYFLPYLSNDMSFFVINWMAELRANGGFLALGNFPGNYTPAYTLLLSLASYLPVGDMLAVKLVSIASDVFLAGCAYVLMRQLDVGENRARIGFAAVFFLPSVIMNSAQWGQCDAIYVGFLLLFLAFVLRGQNWPAMVFYGCAMAFKQQALFLAPLVVLLVVVGRIRIRECFATVASYVVWFLPTILQGGSPRLLYTVYLSQAGQQKERLALLVPNLYNWVTARDDINVQFRLGYLVFGLVITGVATYLLWLGRERLDKKGILLAAAMYSYLCPYVMPQMHERYFFLAGILLLVVTLVWPRVFFTAAICELLSFWSYMQYFYYDETPLAMWLALPPLAVLAALAYMLRRHLFAPEEQTGLGAVLMTQ